MKWGSWLNLALGGWLLFSPWALNYLTGSATGNSVVIGALVLIVSAWSLAVMEQNTAPPRVNLVLGIWLIISPWVLGYVTAAAFWNAIVVGMLLIGFALVRVAAPRPTAGSTV